MSRNTRCRPIEDLLVRRTDSASAAACALVPPAAPLAQRPDSRRSGWRATLLTLAAVFEMTTGAAASVVAPPLPASVRSVAPELRAQGGGELRFFGLSVYDGWFWNSGTAWSLDQPFALDLHYHRSLDGASIAERSSDEIEKLGAAPPSSGRAGAKR